MKVVRAGSVRTHDLARQGQADAGTLGAGGEERVEYMFRVSIGNGPAVVGNMDFGVVGCIDKRRDTDKRDIVCTVVWICGDGTVGSGSGIDRSGGGAVPEAVAQCVDGILEDVGRHS